MQFGIGILIKGAMSKGGYTSCRFLVVKNTVMFSKNVLPECSLKARLGHSKLTCVDPMCLQTGYRNKDGLIR